MLYLVLGCGPGSMGLSVAARLLKETGSIVFVADQNRENVISAERSLRDLPRGTRSCLLGSKVNSGLDVLKEKNKLPDIFRNIDVVISALPADLNPVVANAVLTANETRPSFHTGKTHYCDLGGVLNITKKIVFSSLARRAEACGISLVPDCGFQPGLGNIIAVSLFEHFDLSRPLESLIIYVGGIAENGYRKLFNLKGLEEIYYNWPLVLSSGKPRAIKPLSHYETIPTSDFDLFFGEKEGAIKFEAAVTSGLGALPYYLKDHVLKLQEKTLRWRGHYAEIKKIKSRENFIPEFEKLLSQYPQNQKDFSIIKVVAIGKAKTTGKRTKIECLVRVESDEIWNSMQKIVSSTAVIAKLIAEGKASIGANPPEIALPPKLVLEELKKDFSIYERHTPPH